MASPTQVIDDLKLILETARTLTAPNFNVDRLIKAARAIHHLYPSQPYLHDTTVWDDDLASLRAGGEVAMAWIVTPWLPDELAAYRDRPDANAILIKAYDVANKYIDR